MKRAFRKYHRTLALIVLLPLVLTVMTGMLVTIVAEWSLPIGISRRLLLQIHTGEIFHLESVYPIFNGLGLLAMLITGMTMTPIFRSKPPTMK